MTTLQATRPTKDRQAAAEPNLVELAAAAWAFTSKIGEKEFRRDELTSGASYSVKMFLAAEVNGQVYQQEFEGNVSVGFEKERATSQTPQSNMLIGYLLSKMNHNTREAILRDLPQYFTENGGKYPEFDSAVSEASQMMLKKIRAAQRITVRGSVGCKYQQSEAGLGIVG